ncbi:stomatin-like protein 2 mitochondrial [Holotrichia oblita]|nr:stomatin-like protein 2 mitochondrial [Holotrichia oblita]
METAQLVSIWFAGGALAAVILAALDVAIEFQLLAFAVVSVIALAVIKFLLPKFGLAQSREKFDTTANESIVGKELVVLTAASFFEPGEGKVNGVLWNIYTDEGEKVFPGQIVLIKEIRGIIVLLVVLAVVLLIVVAVLASSFKVVQQANVYVVERLGRHDRNIGYGFHFLVPFFDKVSNKVSLKEKVADFPPQPVITADNVTMQIDTVVYFQVTDPTAFTYNVERPLQAIENLTATTLRNIIGDLELDATLTSRDTINVKMRAIIDEATDPWGIKVTQVELKNIIPPRDIQEAMEKQMRAERERREAVLRAEGEKRSAILVAEGQKESTILRAEAQKMALIAEAQGQAEAIKSIYTAQAAGIKSINEANPNSAYITLKGYEALEKVANGQATKLIIPSELSSVTSLVSSIGEMLKDKK